jgi:chemosensory pili system protein ChpA (sensor histidine kinase/response regulator)
VKQWQNFSAFSKVKTGIESLVADATAIIEEVLSAETDIASAAGKISICVEKLEQVVGVLKTLEYEELALLANEISGYLSESINPKKAYSVEQRVEAWKLVYLTLADFPATLEGILSDQIGEWFEYCTLVNKIRKARNLSLVFDSKPLLTNTKLQFGTLFVTMPANMADLVNKQIEKYKKALELYQHNGNYQLLQKSLYSVFSNLEVMHRDFRMGTLWGLCVGLVETLPADATEAANSSTLKLLRSFTTLMVQLKEHGVAVLSKNIPEKILEQILEAIATSRTSTSRLKAITLWYSLKLSFAKEFRKANKTLLVNFSRKGAYIKAAKFLAEDINKLYDTINAVSEGYSLSERQLQEYMQPLSRIRNVFSALSMPQQVESMDGCLAVFTQYLQTGAGAQHDKSEALLAKTAQTLYQGEVALLAKSQELDRAIFRSTAGQHGADVLVGAKLSLVLAALKTFDTINVVLDNYVEAACDVNVLRGIVTPLEEIHVALSSIPLARAASFINGALKYANKLIALATDKVLAVDASLHDFAHLLLNTRSYLEQLSNDRTANFHWILDPNKKFQENMEKLSGDCFADVKQLHHDHRVALPVELQDTLELVAEAAESLQLESLQIESRQELQLAHEFSMADAGPGEDDNIDPAELADAMALVIPVLSADIELVVNQVSSISDDETDEEDDDDLKAIFTEEAEEILQTQAHCFTTLNSHLGDQEALADLRRSFHTLKGSGRMVEAKAIGELAWSAENLLNSVIAGRLTLDFAVLAVLRNVHDAVPGLIADFREDKPSAVDSGSVAPLIAEVNQFLQPKQEAVAAVAAHIDFAPAVQDMPAVAVTAEAIVESAEESFVENAEETTETEATEFVASEPAASVVAPELMAAPEAELADEEAVAASAIAVVEPVIASVSDLEENVAERVAEIAPVIVQETVGQSVEEVTGEIVEAEIGEEEPFEPTTQATVESFVEETVAALAEEKAEEFTAVAVEAAVQETVEASIQEVPEAQLEETPETTAETTLETTPEAISEVPSSAGHLTEEDKQEEVELFNIFVAEVERQVERIRQYLNNPHSVDDNGLSVTTTSFLIPVHTLYGSCRMAHFEEFGRLINPLERLLQSHPYQTLNTSLTLLLMQFCQMAEHISESVRLHRNFSLQEAMGEQLAHLQLLFAQAETELAGPRYLNALPVEASTAELTFLPANITQQFVLLEEQTAVDQASLILEGFLQEAKTTNALLRQVFADFCQAPDTQERLTLLQEQLRLLEGAASIANENSIADMSHALAIAYQQCSRKLFNMSPVVINALEQAHHYIAQALEALEEGRPLNDSAAIVAALHALLETCIADKTKNDQADSEQKVEEGLLAIFLEEAEEILRELDNRLADWQQTPHDQSISNDLLRSLHTLKGSAALVGESDISEHAHAFESFIIAAIRNPTIYDADFFARVDAQLHVLQAFYTLYSTTENGSIVRRSMSEAPAETTLTDAVATETMENSSTSLVNPDSNTDSNAVAPRSAQVFYIRPDAVPQAQEPKSEEQGAEPGVEHANTVDEQIRVSGNLLRSLLNDADEINIARNRVEQNLDEFMFMLNDMDETLGRLKGYIQKFEVQTKQNRSGFSMNVNNGSGSGSRNDFNKDFDTLEMDRYTEFQQITLSLLEDYDDLSEIKKNLASKLKGVDGVLAQQQRFTNRLQDGLISSQMVPFAGIVPRLRRLTRQISTELGKQVTIKFSNPEGKIDRSILQSLLGPLEHMIRNAIDHGIETPAERLQSGKPEQGTVLIKLYRQGASINLDLSDDGRGINLDSIKRKGVEMGLIKEGATLSEKDAYQLIFAAGFSTASGLSKISGRGVGLDVVHSEISQIGGDIDVLSQLTQGTTFKFRLPLTASLNRALLFTLEGAQYVMLLNTIDGIMLETVDNLRHYATLKEVTKLRYSKKSYDLSYLGSVLDGTDKVTYEDSSHSVPILLISGNSRKMALQVDSIIGSRELVVKPLGSQFSAVTGVSGVVILGDGNVVPVLDPIALVDEYAQQHPDANASLAPIKLVASSDSESYGKTVLVVDDSITVRKVTSAILKRNGMKVLLAKNGVEAVEILQHTLPDVMLLDIEMPKMDGFEVASYIRRQEGALQQLPIIMITSRIGDKHRNRAQEIGVNEYMCKPFQEEKLLEAIASFHVVPAIKQVTG